MKRKNAAIPSYNHLHGAKRQRDAQRVFRQRAARGHPREANCRQMPEIMVFPNGGRATMYQDSGDGRFMAETMMIKELIPHIDATYRTIADRKARCIEGFSMGGRGSTNLAMKYPQLFRLALQPKRQRLSRLRSREAPERLSRRRSAAPEGQRRLLNLTKNLDFIKANMRIQVACGTADPDHLKTVREYHAALTAAGMPHSYFEVEGLDHNQKKMIDGRKVHLV
jgi:enterochelin esterase-like enzyme